MTSKSFCDSTKNMYINFDSNSFLSSIEYNLSQVHIKFNTSRYKIFTIK